MSRGRPWTALDTCELRRLAGNGLTFREIAKALNRSPSHIRQRAEHHGIEVVRVSKRKIWPAKATETLLRMFPTYSAGEIAAELGVTVATVHRRANLLGLRKSKGWRAERTARRWLEGRHETSRASVETRFNPVRPSSAARNYIPIGALRVTNEGSLERKVTDDPRLAPARRWVAVARLVWEAAHGPIPSGHVVRFRDGMHTTVESDITPDRLECITRRENMRRNSIHNYPQPIPQLVQLRGALNRKINNRRKNA